MKPIKISNWLFGLICFFILVKNAAGQEHYQIPYNNSEISIDGHLTEWKHYLSIFFSDTLTQLRPLPERPLMAYYDDKAAYSKTWHPLSKNKVEVRMCWNLNHLFFAFKVEDEHIFSEVKPAEDHFPIQEKQ